jgi:hypothetical protein
VINICTSGDEASGLLEPKPIATPSEGAEIELAKAIELSALLKHEFRKKASLTDA